MTYEFEPACRRMEWLGPFYKAVWEKAFADAIPISGTFELTPRCNFNCRMCYVHLKPEQIPQYGRELMAKEWIRIAQEAKEAGTTWLCVTGGEPLMHPEFETIWKELTQMGFFITLQTNASMIQGKIEKLFEKYPPRTAKITLYGSNDEIYESVCKVKEGFKRVDRGIRTLCEMKIPVQLVSTVIKQNDEDVKKMADYAFSHRLPWIVTYSIKDSCRGANSEAKNVRVGTKSKVISSQGKTLTMDLNRKPCTYCKDYRLGYWIVWNGEMRFCSFMNEPNIQVREKGFLKSWHELVEYEEALEWPKECKICEVNKTCFKCAGTLAAECGSPHKVNQEFCDKIKNKK